MTCTKKIESLEWSDDHFILRIHGDGGYRAERRERDHHSLVSLLNLTASLWAPNLCQAWCWVLGLNFDNPRGYQGKKCAQQKKYWFLYNIKDWFSLSPRVLANSKDSTLGAPHLPSFLRHKWPILRAVELCLKNVKCIWKLHIFADARSPELRCFHGQPLGRPSVGASQMTSWSTLSRPPRGISCNLRASLGKIQSALTLPGPPIDHLARPSPCGSFCFLLFTFILASFDCDLWVNQSLHFLQPVILKTFKHSEKLEE